MKTSTFKNEIKRHLFILMTLFAVSAIFVSCTEEEEVTEEGILGSYEGGSEESDHIEIYISKSGSGYSFSCEYENWEGIRASVETEKHEWTGKFENIPSDVVKDNQGNKIGTISFRQYSEYTEVTFRAETIRPGTYSAKKMMY